MRTLLLALLVLVAPAPGWADEMPGENFWLREYLKVQIGDTPALRDIDRVRRLRDWVYGTVPVGYLACYLKSDAGTPILLQRVFEGKGGYYCGGTATILRDVYRLFGYEAFTYNMGFVEDGATHVTTLVRVDAGDGPVLAIEDAYFGFEIRDKAGRVLDFTALLADLSDGTIDDIVIHPEAPGCKVLMAPRHALAKAIERIEFHNPRPLPDRDGNAAFCGTFTLAHFYARPRFERQLARHAGHTDFAWIFAFPLDTSGDPRVKALVEQAGKIAVPAR